MGRGTGRGRREGGREGDNENSNLPIDKRDNEEESRGECVSE